MRYYQVCLLKDAGSPGPLRLIEYVNETLIPGLAASTTRYGVFHGLFGLASNEIYLVLSSDKPGISIKGQWDDQTFELIESIDLMPTVRPTDHSARHKEGIYVFRWFEILNKDVAEIAALSEEAWVTFEGGFDTEVQALFAENDHSETDPNQRGKMLLITWYRDLATWQDSRKPPAEARDNFLRRHQLTLEARPVATRLVTQ